ncbi:hypothetical protein ACFFGH_04565 [Lysobacter korlensis]|uniref:Alpha/beta hydrolase n=1 Tax=Lysobacter korlensis TaxID=553636 RepID=A0ABV6RMJ9_9GAMM
MAIRHRFATSLMALIACLGGANAHAMPTETLADGTILVRPAEQALVVSGPIGTNFEAHFRAALKRYPQAQVVIVRGPGGMRGPALRVAELINSRGMTVRISGRCASACALLWASSRSREMTPTSKLGLHRSRLPDSVMLPAPIEQRLVARNDRETDRVLRDAGFSLQLIAQGNRASPTSMSWFTPVELQRNGVPFTLLGNPLPGAAVHLAANATVTTQPTQQ